MTTRWGIAATGGMAAAFTEDLAHVPGAEVAFVGSRSRESAADFADRFGADGSGTYADLLAAGLTESRVMPLSDTLDVQWVLEEALDQLGIQVSEAQVEL